MLHQFYHVVPYSWPLLLQYLALLSVVSACGAVGARYVRNAESGATDDIRVVLSATLTLLALVVGFAFSLAIGGYNARQANEAMEANRIESAFFKAELLPGEDAGKVRGLLRQYLDARLRFYQTGHGRQTDELAGNANLLRSQMWAIVARNAGRQPNPVAVLPVSAMSDLLGSYENSTASWRSQIPPAAWGLITALAAFCSALIGYSAGVRNHRGLLVVFPAVISISLALIADIDVPGRGLIHVSPDNLARVASLIAGA
ncbi:bestrophin-like domain [Cupriavidus basilensis]|uniref:bestrophin-like domain n=1 Tax=Cupriavidus basilensis TaxID=68895 RepID=UPI0007506FD4|nr:hypothetical protein [Cupriavidus basilensis]